MAKKLIEIVCKCNISRSPVAESVAKRFLQDFGASAEYGVISSGVSVDKITHTDYTLSEFQDALKVGDKIGYLNLQTTNLIRNLSEQSEGKEFQRIKKEIVNYFVARELEQRKKTLMELGFHDPLKKSQNQTVHRDDVVAICPVDSYCYEKVAGLYSSPGQSPIIEILSSMASGKPGDEIIFDNSPNSLKEFEANYKKGIKKVIHDTQKAIENLITQGI